MDELIGAKQKLVRFDPQAGESIKKWTKEIIALDADNKAGLKKKYQFEAALSDAGALMREGKADEAAAALDKALETAGLTGEQIQKAQFVKAQLALFVQHNQEQGVECLKKALEAAPKSELAPQIQAFLRQFEKAKKPAPKKAEDE